MANNALLNKGNIVKENGKIIFTDPIFRLIVENYYERQNKGETNIQLVKTKPVCLFR